MMPPEDERDDRTVFKPQGSAASVVPPSAKAQPRQIQVGDILNHIFEVKRFIARGGMGEVFEGINVSSEERVAIKVMLPTLAADPNVQAMFRKEARTLTRLSHPALVQYRVLAQEPVLGVFYIVTEYVDGQNLSDVLGEQNATLQELTDLTRRLAQGLDAAHALGAIHRDISPDNVMLEGGKLAGAKIIDFGIAKDLDPGSATIIGDGFAGKLNYVSPEQLGDYDRSVGPWTDVYSLGLVILAVAMKRDVNMGGTLVDAVDKRRAGPDLSVIPVELRPVLEAMLKANPIERLRSTGAVIEMLSAPLGSAPPRRLAGAKPVEARSANTAGAADWIKAHIPAVAGGSVALVAAVAGLVYLTSGDGTAPVAPQTGNEIVAERTTVPSPPADPIATARAALDAGLPSIACTWLDVVSVTGTDSGVSVVLRGVAGNPAQAQTQIGKLLFAKGINVSDIDSTDVAPIQGTECGPLEAFRQIRSISQNGISVPQRQFEMAPLAEGEFKGTIGAKAVINFDFSDGAGDYALFGLEPSGLISEEAKTKSEITNGFTPISKNKYRLDIDVNHPGWSGVLLLSGLKPINAGFVAGPPGSRNAAWTKRFLTAAREGGWKAEMVWFKTVDEQPN